MPKENTKSPTQPVLPQENYGLTVYPGAVPSTPILWPAVQHIGNQVQQTKGSAKPQATCVQPTTQPNQSVVAPRTTPSHVSNVRVVSRNVGGQKNITVQFDHPSGDPYFSGAKVYLRSGSKEPVLVASGAHSPLTFTATNDSAPHALHVTSVGNWGETDVLTSPSAPVKLFGPLNVSKVNSNAFASGGGITPTPPPSSVSDGLIHGNPVWDIDSAVVWFRDDFLCVASGATPGTISSAGLLTSEVAWFIVPATTMIPLTGAIPNLGALLFPLTGTKEGSSGAANFLVPFSAASDSAGLNTGWALFDKIGWACSWVFSFQRSVSATLAGSAPAFSIGQQCLYIGLGNLSILGGGGGTLSSSNPNRPPCFFGLRYDTDNTDPAISDTTMHFEAVCNVPSASRNNTQGNTFDTGVTPVEFVEYRLDLLYTTAGQLIYTLSGNGSSVTATLNVPNAPTSASCEFNAATGYGTIKTNGWNASWTNGSIITIAGYSGAGVAFNGVHQIVNIGGSNGQFNIILGGTSGSGSIDATGIITGYPGVFPWFSWGNDTEVTPTANRNGLLLDFIGFVWNPGVGGGMGTPNVKSARYF